MIKSIITVKKSFTFEIVIVTITLFRATDGKREGLRSEGRLLYKEQHPKYL